MTNNNILIIEDEKPLAYTYKKALELHGYSVLCAENGAIGLQYLRTVPVSLVILDLNMPVMDGIEFMSEFVLEPSFQDIKVLVKSAALYEYKRQLSNVLEGALLRLRLEKRYYGREMLSFVNRPGLRIKEKLDRQQKYITIWPDIENSEQSAEFDKRIGEDVLDNVKSILEGL